MVRQFFRRRSLSEFAVSLAHSWDTGPKHKHRALSDATTLYGFPIKAVTSVWSERWRYRIPDCHTFTTQNEWPLYIPFAKCDLRKSEVSRPTQDGLNRKAVKSCGIWERAMLISRALCLMSVPFWKNCRTTLYSLLGTHNLKSVSNLLVFHVNQSQCSSSPTRQIYTGPWDCPSAVSWLRQSESDLESHLSVSTPRHGMEWLMASSWTFPAKLPKKKQINSWKKGDNSGKIYTYCAVPIRWTE